MTIVEEELTVNRHYLIIDSPIDFEIVVNDGTDIVHRVPGCWQIDCFHLLPERFQPQYPAYKLKLRYDKDLLPVGKTISISITDIDLGMSIVGTDGQNVMVRNFPEFYKVENNTDSSDNKIPVDVDIKNFSDMPAVVLPENYKVTNELDNNNNRIPLEVKVKDSFFLYNLTFNSYNEFRQFILDNNVNIQGNALYINSHNIALMELSSNSIDYFVSDRILCNLNPDTESSPGTYYGKLQTVRFDLANMLITFFIINISDLPDVQYMNISDITKFKLILTK